MKKRKLAILLIIIIFGFVGCTGNTKKTPNKNITNTKQLTQKEKLDDFEYMYMILKENYPYFEVNKREYRIDWLAKKSEYISKIKSTTNDEDFFNALQSILSELNNYHVSMLDKNFYLYAKNVFEENSKLYEPWLKQFNNPKAIARYSNISETENNLKPSSNYIIPNNVKTNILEKDKVAYLSIHSFNTFNIDGDMKIIKSYLKDIKNYKALIIDIRNNGGGDSRYWANNIVPMLINKTIDYTEYTAYRGGSFVEQFIKCRRDFGYDKLEPISNINKENLKNLPPELKKDFKYYSKDIVHYKPENSVGFKGKIYVLINSNVFSSSEAFAVFAKSTDFATLVGERTGGDGIGSDPAFCVLPNSGYIFNFSEQMGLTADGTCNFEYKTEPDIMASAKMDSNISNDELVQYVLKLVEQSEI